MTIKADSDYVLNINPLPESLPGSDQPPCPHSLSSLDQSLSLSLNYYSIILLQLVLDLVVHQSEGQGSDPCSSSQHIEASFGKIISVLRLHILPMSANMAELDRMLPFRTAGCTYYTAYFLACVSACVCRPFTHRP